VRWNDRETKRLADAVVGSLNHPGIARLTGQPGLAADCVQRILAENLRAEQEIEDEAERLADRHAREMAGMDRRKIVLGIKERIARERGFVL
jgi:hypothetical protein